MNKPVVIFNEKEHSYTVDGKLATSVTRILQEVGITKKIEEIQFLVDNPHILEEARDRGNYYDRLAEEAVLEMKYEKEEWDLNAWQLRITEELEKIGCQIPLAQERLGMTDDLITIAGTPDVLEEVNHYVGEKLYIGIIVDIKATGQIRINDVTWQTNLYAWLRNPEEHDKYAKYVMHYDEKNDKITTIPLENISLENIEKLITAFLMGEQYIEQYEVVDPVAFNSLMKEIKDFEEKLKEKQKELEKQKEKIKETMKLKGIKTVENDYFKITYTPVGTRNNFDQEAWRKSKNIPEPTEEEKKEFIKVSNVKDRLTITEKK